MTGAALVAASWVPARREPSHRSEMVSQWLCGEVLRPMEEESGWVRCRGPGGYEGWAPAGGLVRASEEEAGAWSGDRTLLSWGTGLRPAGDGPPGAAAADAAITAGRPGALAPAYLPRGGRARPIDGSAEVALPGGRRAEPVDPAALLTPERRAREFPPAAEAVVRTALRWLGTPYLWGGRTEHGVDCSGFVQSVLAFHGTVIPRDSPRQREAGPEVPASEGLSGDLLFFAPEGRGITHVALAAEGAWIVHAAASNGQVAADDLAGDGALAARLRASLVARTRPLGASRPPRGGGSRRPGSPAQSGSA